MRHRAPVATTICVGLTSSTSSIVMRSMERPRRSALATRLSRTRPDSANPGNRDSAAAVLTAPGRLVVHGTQGRFAAASVTRAFAAAGAASALRVEDRSLTVDEIVAALGPW